MIDITASENIRNYAHPDSRRIEIQELEEFQLEAVEFCHKSITQCLEIAQLLTSLERYEY